MKIGIFPKIVETYKNQFELCLDIRFKRFFEKTFPDYSTNLILSHKEVKEYDLIVITGGNNLKLSKNQITSSDYLREKLSKKIVMESLKLNKKILGICYGAQLIAKLLNSKIVKKKHIGEHQIFTKQKKIKKKNMVNSYHNYVIKKLGTNLKILAWANDGSIEAYKHKKKKILGIMWHPERDKNIRKISQDLLKTLWKK